MSLVRCLAGHAQRLGDLLPRPAFVNCTFHCLALHAVGQAAKADDCRDRDSGIVGRGCHTRTIPAAHDGVNVG